MRRDKIDRSNQAERQLCFVRPFFFFFRRLTFSATSKQIRSSAFRRAFDKCVSELTQSSRHSVDCVDRSLPTRDSAIFSFSIFDVF